MGKATNTEPKEEITFEEAIQSLEQIVKDMEGERLPLDQLVRRYEDGSRLLRTCEQRIREAEQRIEVIAAGEAGPELKPFEAAPKQAPAGTGEARVAKREPVRKEPPVQEVQVSDPASGSEGDGENSGGEEEIQLF